MTTEVRIYCDEASHGSKGVEKIETYKRGAAGQWTAVYTSLRTAERWTAKREGRPPARWARRPADPVISRMVEIDGARHWRQRLQCGLCQNSLAVRTRRLWAVLDELAEDGKDEVALNDLRARVL